MDKLRVSSFGRGAVHNAAVEKGIYAAEELEIELDVTQSSKVQLQQLIDGEWQLIHTNADNVVWWCEDNGADLLIVAALESKPGQDLVVRPEVSTYEDLRGKVIAVDAAESGFVTPLRVLLKEAGLNEGDDYTFVEFGATQGRVDAMEEGQAYAGMINEGRDLGDKGLWAMDTINRLYTRYAGSIAVTREWASANEELAVRYLRTQVKATAAVQGDGWKPSFSWEGLKAMMQTRQDVGWLRGAVDPHRFADETLFNKAVASLS
ncbi:MAG: PhnD/SsuA/transferrin family substrate-binding protein [Dehalococcoidia bacterium]